MGGTTLLEGVPGRMSSVSLPTDAFSPRAGGLGGRYRAWLVSSNGAEDIDHWGGAVDRGDCQRLANDRIVDAKALLAARRWAAAYYMAGYAVECALKSCVLARLASEVELIFEDRRYSEKCWTHDLAQLVALAGLTDQLKADTAADPDLLANWIIVKNWSESSRYQRMPKNFAEGLYNAITDKKHGILPWIKQRW
jgi:hypothetical protein